MTVDLSTFTDTARLLIQVPISGNMFVANQDLHTPTPEPAVPARAPAAASATMTQRVRAAPADVPSASSRPMAFTTSASMHPVARLAPPAPRFVKTEPVAEMHADEVAATTKQAVTEIFRGHKREHHDVVARILFFAALVSCAAMVAFAPTGPAHQSTKSGFKQWVCVLTALVTW